MVDVSIGSSERDLIVHAHMVHSGRQKRVAMTGANALDNLVATRAGQAGKLEV